MAVRANSGNEGGTALARGARAAASSRPHIARPSLLLGRAVVALAFLALWQGLAGRVFPEYLTSNPVDVGRRLVDWIATGYLWPHLFVTVEETLGGFVLGAAAGVAVGVTLGLVRFAGEVAEPFATAAFSLPKVALAPLLVVWFGIGLEMKVVLAALNTFFLVFWSVYTGVRQTDQELVDVVRVMSASRRDLLLKVILPGARPWIYNGLRTGLPYAFVGAIVGEIIASNQGLGYVVQYSASVFDTTGLLAALVVLVFIAVGLNEAVSRHQRRAMRWQVSAEG